MEISPFITAPLQVKKYYLGNEDFEGATIQMVSSIELFGTTQLCSLAYDQSVAERYGTVLKIELPVSFCKKMEANEDLIIQPIVDGLGDGKFIQSRI